jgi:hypothetical protein
MLASSYRGRDWTLVVGTDPVHGCLGVIVVATRGAAGPGEALSIRGSLEHPVGPLFLPYFCTG